MRTHFVLLSSLLLVIFSTIACAIEEGFHGLNDYHVSGYKVRVPEDINNAIAKAAEYNRRNLIVTAVDIIFTERFISVPPQIRMFRLYATRCTANQTADIGISVSAKANNADPAIKPTLPIKADGSASVTVLCGELNEMSRFSLYAIGARGTQGWPGESGDIGDDGIPAKSDCRRGTTSEGTPFCYTYGSDHVPPKYGTDGEKGGPGGEGGDGGFVRLLYNKTPGVEVEVFRYGGPGGKGGEGGPAGQNGGRGNPSEGQRKKCFRKECKKFHWKQPYLTPRKPGEQGDNGAPGKRHTTSVDIYELSSTKASNFLPSRDLIGFVRLLERFFIDSVLANPGSPEAQRVLEFIVDLTAKESDSQFLANAYERAISAQSRLSLGIGILGGKSIERYGKQELKERLEVQRYQANLVSGTLDDLRTTERIKDFIATSINSTIPGTNFDALLRQQDIQRNQTILGIRTLDSMMADTIKDIDKAMEAAEEETGRARTLSRLFAYLGAGFGLVQPFQTEKMVDSLNDAGNVFSTLGDLIANDLEVMGRTCKAESLKKVLITTEEELTAFPNQLDFYKDFSRITGIEAVHRVQSAKLGGLAELVISDVSCVFLTSLPNGSTLEAQFRRFFIEAQARIDFIADLIEIDTTKNTIKEEKKGVEWQRESLERLKNDDNPSQIHVFDVLSDMYEEARLHVLRATFNLARTLSLKTLVKYDDYFTRYGKDRLAANGAVGKVLDFKQLNALYTVISNDDGVNKGCLLEESPTTFHYFFDFTPTSHPSLFERGLRTGIDFERRQVITLNFDTTCTDFRGGKSNPPKLESAPILYDMCRYPRDSYDVRLHGITAQVIFPDNVQLPEEKKRIILRIEQMGDQYFHKSENAIVSFDINPLLFEGDEIDLNLRTGPVSYGTTLPETVVRAKKNTASRKLANASQRSDITYPSLYATYAISLGDYVDPVVDAALKNATALRLHVKVKERLRSC